MMSLNQSKILKDCYLVRKTTEETISSIIPGEIFSQTIDY